MVAIKQQLVASRAVTSPGINGRKYITVHETDNTKRGADAQAHADLQSNGNSREASWHWEVDDKQAIQSFPHTVRCWAAGDGKGDGNYNSIHVEICVNSDGDFNKAVINATALVRKIMADENISINNVVQHNHWSRKNCPRNLRSGSHGVNWSQFKNMLKGGNVLTTYDKNAKPSPLLAAEFKKAVDLGITDGTYVKRPATREEVAVMIVRALGKK